MPIQVTFGVAPAAIAFSIGYRTLIDQLLLTFYVLCGLTRLARFNITVQMLPKDKTGKSKYFEGVPVPFACFTSSTFMAYWSYTAQIGNSIPYGTYLTGSFLEFHPTVLIYVVCGTLMVCTPQSMVCTWKLTRFAGQQDTQSAQTLTPPTRLLLPLAFALRFSVQKSAARHGLSDTAAYFHREHSQRRTL